MDGLAATSNNPLIKPGLNVDLTRTNCAIECNYVTPHPTGRPTSARSRDADQSLCDGHISNGR